MEKKIGTITHFFGNIKVGIIKLDDQLKVGDKVLFKGSTTDFEQEIKEMQENKESIDAGKAGQEIGVKVTDKVRVGDEVFAV